MLEKESKKHLEVLKNELDKMAIKLNLYDARPWCDLAKKYSEKLLINGFSFLTECGRILKERLIRERGVVKKLSL